MGHTETVFESGRNETNLVCLCWIKLILDIIPNRKLRGSKLLQSSVYTILFYVNADANRNLVLHFLSEISFVLTLCDLGFRFYFLNIYFIHNSEVKTINGINKHVVR